MTTCCLRLRHIFACLVKNILCLVIKMERDPFFFFLQLIPTAHYVTSVWLLMFQLQDTVY